MRTIFKYPIKITDKQELKIPHGTFTHFTHAGLDSLGQPCIWVDIIDPEAEEQTFVVHVIGTGSPLPSGANLYVGSFIYGMFVWHVYV